MLLVGDYPSQEDLIDGVSYSGNSGKLLKEILKKGGVLEEPIYLTLFKEHPPKGNIKHFFDKKTLKPQYASAVEDLYKEILKYSPHLVVPLGGTALWALTGSEGIKDARGYLSMDQRGLFKILPTYDIKAIFKNYSLRLASIYDFRKALRHDNSHPIEWPKRQVSIYESAEEVHGLVALLREAVLRGSISDLGVDIETHIDLQQISCISFATGSAEAHVIPLLRVPTKENLKRGLHSEEEEAKILARLQMILALPCRKMFHNAAFDCSHLANNDIYVSRVDDTMIKAHSLQPEIQKSLGFLGSIATEEKRWKNMRARSKEEEKDED